MLDLALAQPQVEAMAETLAARKTQALELLTGTPAKVLVNFSPTLLDPTMRSIIGKQIGAEIIEVHLPAKLDLARPLRPQVAELAQKMVKRLYELQAEALDYIIPPYISAAAHMLAEILNRADPNNPVGVVWFKQRNQDTIILGGIE